MVNSFFLKFCENIDKSQKFGALFITTHDVERRFVRAKCWLITSSHHVLWIRMTSLHLLTHENKHLSISTAHIAGGNIILFVKSFIRALRPNLHCFDLSLSYTPFTRGSKHEGNVLKIHVDDVCSQFASS